jgi:hypothetical protein
MRRGPSFQWRYLLNTDSDHLEVHDLDNEQTGPSECQINEIIAAGNAKYLIGVNNEQQLVQWLSQNPSYDGCLYCLPHLHRK